MNVKLTVLVFVVHFRWWKVVEWRKSQKAEEGSSFGLLACARNDTKGKAPSLPSLPFQTTFSHFLFPEGNHRLAGVIL